MNPFTNQLLLTLSSADWFCNTSNLFAEENDVTRVGNWDEALDVSKSQASEDARLEAQNELSVHLFLHDKNALTSWNPKIKELRPLVIQMIDKKLAEPKIMARLPINAGEKFVDSLRRDLLGLCLSYEYKDAIKSRYYELLEHWLILGRFPCGWIGQVPDNMKDAFTIGKMAVL